MKRTNHIRIIQILAGIIIAIVGFMWVDLKREIDRYAERLRLVELNQQKMLTVLNVSPAVSERPPGSTPGPELLISHTETPPRH